VHEKAAGALFFARFLTILFPVGGAMTLSVDIIKQDALNLLRAMENMDMIRLDTPAEKAAPAACPRDMLAFRTGFLAGQVSIPPDFDTMGQAEITELFGGTR
jgi:hypothetical protein